MAEKDITEKQTTAYEIRKITKVNNRPAYEALEYEFSILPLNH
jgi:hypothetical protein